MNKLLKTRPTLNTYEYLYDKVSSKPIFKQDEWSLAANEGTLNMYASGIEKFESLGIDYEKYKNELNLDYADTQTRMIALYNEVYADRENKKERSRTAYNSDGSSYLEKYLASDYEYTKELIKNKTDYAEQQERERVAREMKDSASVWEHIKSTFVGIPTGIAYGFMTGLEKFTAFFGGMVNYVLSVGEVDPAKYMAESYGRMFGNLPDYIVEFESNYTTLRYENGEYTNYGKYIGGASTSVGEMLPSMLMGIGLGKGLTTAGYTLSSASKIGSAVSQGTFYGGMFAGNVRDSYYQFQAMGADVDSSSILANAAVKSALQWGIEKTLGKMLGTTSVDNVFFGRAQRSLAKNPTAISALGRILKDAGQEGLEEVLQDTSDFLVNEAFADYIDAYGVNNDISFQSLLDAFIIGAITSVAGSAVDVIKSNRIYTSTGEKLSKLAGWEYGINMESFYRNIGEIMNNSFTVDSDLRYNNLGVVEGAALEAYASYRVITSIYEEIGDKRFKDANEILNKITERIKSHNYGHNNITSYVNTMKEQLSHISAIAVEKVAGELRKKDVTESKETIKADDVKTKEARSKLEELLSESGAKSISKTDGNIETEVDGHILIAENRLNDESINEILQNLSVQNLVSHLSELSNKERVRDNLSKTYEEYYGKTASENADVIALLFDADFFKAVLMKNNKDVFKYLSYFAEAEKNLVRGKRRDEIYRNKINEIRNHWFNHLADYCIIHEEANPTMFLNYISDAKKRKEIENKVKRGRWSIGIYNRVLLSESNLDKLSENEKVVLKTRFDNAFPKNVATRHWNNVNSNNAKARQQSMNALSKKCQGLFSNGYDGVTYMPDVSIGNRVFNKFLRSLGLDLSTVLSKNYLTESDIKLIVEDYGEINEHNVYKFRQMQFKEMSTIYEFSISKSGNFEVTHNGKIVGFSKYRKLQKDIEAGKKADTFVSDSKVKSDRLSKLINPRLTNLNSSYYTIDDVITDPQLLKAEVQDEIVKFANEKYGLKLTKPTVDTTFLYLRNYFLSEYKDMTIVSSSSGEFVFASVEKVVNLFKDPNIKITEKTKLTDIVKEKYIPEGLNLKIVKDWDGAEYVPYKNVDKDGTTITVFDNTIYLGNKIFADGDEYVRFAFAHEFQHAVQFANNINTGADFTWISKVSDKQRKEIIADVRKHKPELFKNVKAGSGAEASIVNDYIYHSTGESDAYGLQGNEVLDFVPVLSKNDKNVLTFTMPWGTTHKIKNVEKADVISSIWKKEADNIWHFTDVGDLNANLNFDESVDDWRIQTGIYRTSSLINFKDEKYQKKLNSLIQYQASSKNYELINGWRRLPMNTKNPKSEGKKEELKKSLTAEDKAYSIALLHHVIAPAMDINEFVNSDINFVRMQKRGHLGDSPFVSIYAGVSKGGRVVHGSNYEMNLTVDSIKFCLQGFYEISSHREDVMDTYIILGTFKPKDILYYIASDESEVLIEPSKLNNSKIFKCNNRLIIKEGTNNPYEGTVVVVNEDGEMWIDPYLDFENDGFAIISNFTGEIYLEGNWNSFPKQKLMAFYLGDNVSDEQKGNMYSSNYKNFENQLSKVSSLISDGKKITNVIKCEGIGFDGATSISLDDLSVYRSDRGELDIAVTDPNGRTITPEETETSLAELESLYGMSLKRTPKYLKEDDPRAKDFISTGARPNHQYKERLYELNEDGTQRLDKQGKPIYRYVPSKKETRYVSKRKYEGTNLEYFTKTYKRTQMSPELQNFVLNAKDLDPFLQERIDGKLKGTLTEQDVFDYIRSKNDIDDNTFKQINNAFFKNKYLENFSELNNLIDHEMRESWAIYRMFKLDEKLKGNEVLLDTEGISFDYLYELIERNDKYKKMYAGLLSQYDNYHNKSFEINEAYARVSYLRSYDGTIKSQRKIAAIVRLAAILNWNTTQKNNKFDIADSYSEAVEDLDMDKDAMIDAIKMRELAKKAKELEAEGKSYNEAKMESLRYVMELSYELDAMSLSEIKSKYSGENADKVALEGMVVDALGNYIPIPDNTVKITSSHLVNRMRGALNSLKSVLTPKEIDRIVKENDELFDSGLKIKRELYQDEVPNKTREGVHYVNKSPEEVEKVLDRVLELCSDIREEKRIGKYAFESQQKYLKELERKTKRLERELKNQKADKIPKIIEYVTDEGPIRIESNKEIPIALHKILRVQYSKTAKTSIQNLSKDNERHIKMVANTFYDYNAENLNALTQSDVDEIIDFYLKTDVPFNEATARYQSAEIWVLTHIIKAGRHGSANFVVDSDTLEKIEKLLETVVQRSAVTLSTWRHALKQLNPEAVIASSMARRSGLNITEADVNTIIKAIETRQVDKIREAKEKVYERLLAEENSKKTGKKNRGQVLDKILQWERLSMLSGPGTWVRNWTSNQTITGINKISDKFIEKCFPKNGKIENQYQIAGTKISKEVYDYIENNLKNNGLLDLIMESLSKYDVRKPVTGKSNELVLAEMVTKSIIGQFKGNYLFNSETGQKLEAFIRKKISDDKFVRKAALSYLGKMITEDIESGRIKAKNEVLWSDGVSKQFMTYVAEAFKLASYDYMHKSNFLFALESQLAKKSTTAYFMYKQVFPFAGASWNWFMEGLKYNPVALGFAIRNYAKLENTIDKYERKRQNYDNNDIGVSSDFARYLTLRDISKGVIGTTGMLIGVLLAGFGWARIDEEDDKYKLFIAGGKAAIDISDVFGTQGIFLGIAMTSTMIDEKADVVDLFAATLDQMFIDSTFADFFNTFRYSQSFGEWLTYQPYNVLNMNVPNFLKTITSLTTPPYTVKYNDGMLGKIERLAVSAIPRLSYAFPHYYDPYTGEKQIAQKSWLLTKSIDKLTPLGLSIYNITDEERLAIEQGVHKTQLTGRYTVGDDSIRLNAKDVERLNELYGRLNAADIKELKSNTKTYKVKQANGTFKNLRWSQMTDKEKATVIDRIMTYNSGYAKVYILTDSGEYKYYATESEFKALRALGITKNVYRKNNKYSGFIKAS